MERPAELAFAARQGIFSDMAREPYLPSGLSRAQTRKTLASLNVNIWLRSVCDTICAGTTFVFVAFALALGVPKERMGYLSSALGLACILQLVGLMLSGRASNKKRFVVTLAMLEPMVLIGAVLLVPFAPPAWRFSILALAMFAAAGLLHLTKPLTEEWSAATIPAGLRGRYLGRRLQVLTVVTIGTVLIVGFLAQRFDTENPIGFGVLMAIGGLFGWLALLPLRHVSLPTLSAESQVSIADLAGIWRHGPFMRYLLGLLIFAVPFAVAIPYYQVFHLDILGLDTARIAVMQTGYLVTKVAVSRLAGRWCDRYGPRRIMLLVAPLYLLFFFMYALARPGLAWPVYAAWIIVGTADSFYFVAYISAIYSTVPAARNRSAYFAVLNLGMLGFYALGAALAVPLVQSLREVEITIGSWHMEQFQLHYLICALVMLPAIGGLLLFPSKSRRRPSP